MCHSWHYKKRFFMQKQMQELYRNMWHICFIWSRKSKKNLYLDKISRLISHETSIYLILVCSTFGEVSSDFLDPLCDRLTFSPCEPVLIQKSWTVRLAVTIPCRRFRIFRKYKNALLYMASNTSVLNMTSLERLSVYIR